MFKIWRRTGIRISTSKHKETANQILGLFFLIDIDINIVMHNFHLMKKDMHKEVTHNI